MNEDARSLLKSLELPDYIPLLLEIYGIQTMNALTQLNESTIEEVVAYVKNGTLEEIVDLDSKENKIKYLGFDYKNLQKFNFAPFHLKSLRKVSELAQITQRMIQANMKSEVTSDNSTENENDADNSNTVVMIKKKDSPRGRKSKETFDQESVIAETILTKTNECLAASNIPNRATPDNIKVLFIESKNIFSAHIDCPVAGCEKTIALGFSQYLSPSIANFKRHVHINHLNQSTKRTSSSMRTEVPVAADNYAESDIEVEETEVIRKRKSLIKGKLTFEQADAYQEDLIAQILSKTNECLAETIFPDRALSENIKVSYDQDKKMYSAHVDCPVAGCNKAIALSFSQYLSPSMANYRRHVNINHLCLIQKRTPSKISEKHGESEVIEPIVKKKKSFKKGELTYEQAVAYEEVLVSQILSKANEILSSLPFHERASSENIKVSYDVDKKMFSASVDCPVAGCQKMSALSFSQYMSPSVANFKRHLTNHLDIDTGTVIKSMKSQPNRAPTKTKQSMMTSQYEVERIEELEDHDTGGEFVEELEPEPEIMDYCFICHEQLGSIRADFSVASSFSEKSISNIFESFSDCKLSDEVVLSSEICENCYIKFNELDEHQTNAKRIEEEILMAYHSIKYEQEDYLVEQDDNIVEVMFINDENSETFEEFDRDTKKLKIKSKLKSPGKRLMSRTKKDPDEGLIVVEVGGEKAYQCEFCNKICSDRIKLKKHHLIHDETIYQCDICQKTYKSFSSYQQHKKTHEEKSCLQCDLCDKRYTNKTLMRRHIESIHLQRKDHICAICGKGFALVSTLNTHMFSHQDNRDVVCALCGFRTYNNQKMKRHMTSHTKERNFSCHICDKRFLYSYNVQAHIKHVHERVKRPTNEEKLTCQFCNKRFPLIWKLKLHLAEVHQIIEEEEGEPNIHSKNVHLPK